MPVEVMHLEHHKPDFSPFRRQSTCKVDLNGTPHSRPWGRKPSRRATALAVALPACYSAPGALRPLCGLLWCSAACNGSIVDVHPWWKPSPLPPSVSRAWGRGCLRGDRLRGPPPALTHLLPCGLPQIRCSFSTTQSKRVNQASRDARLTPSPRSPMATLGLTPVHPKKTKGKSSVSERLNSGRPPHR